MTKTYPLCAAFAVLAFCSADNAVGDLTADFTSDSPGNFDVQLTTDDVYFGLQVLIEAETGSFDPAETMLHLPLQGSGIPPTPGYIVLGPVTNNATTIALNLGYTLGMTGLTGTFDLISFGGSADLTGSYDFFVSTDVIVSTDVGEFGSAAGMPGDFNNDTVVDAADYALWRDSLNSNTALQNDNDLGTPIGQQHYELWRTNFGAGIAGASQAAAGSLTSAPEPAALGLALLAAGAWTGVRRRRDL